MDGTTLDLTKLLGFRLQGTAAAETTGLKKGDKGIIEIPLGPPILPQ
ncbi:hypothetical protein [Histidinibacterium lentulum]|nr:hypothetical protein [Histidinibacterium lentulum]